MEIKDILTVLFGGAAGAFITHFFTSRRSFMEYQLKKLEEIAAQTHKYCDLVEKAFTPYRKPKWQEVPLPQIIAAKREILERAEVIKQAMEILIEFYFENLTLPFKNLTEPTFRLETAASEMEGKPDTWTPDPRSYETYGRVETSLADIATYRREFHNRIIETAALIKTKLIGWPFGDYFRQ
jgi:hypothetical protein